MSSLIYELWKLNVKMHIRQIILFLGAQLFLLFIIQLFHSDQWQILFSGRGNIVTWLLIQEAWQILWSWPAELTFAVWLLYPFMRQTFIKR